MSKNLFKITAEECKNFTSGWRASLENVAAETHSCPSRHFRKDFWDYYQ